MLSERLLGSRIVLRYRRAESDGRPPLSDLVGELLELTPDSVTVRSRAGDRTIPRSAVLLARPVGASRRDILALARISRLGWRAEHQVELAGWLLSADHGWTGRANSVLPLQTPRRPLDELLAEARAFYASHRLPLWIQLPLPARGLLDAELAGRCWQQQRPAIVLTRTLTGPAPAGPPVDRAPAVDLAAVELGAAPDDAWLAACHVRGGPLPDNARQLLTRHDTVIFASIRLAGRTVAVGRGCVDEGWLGITSVEVAPDRRRQGLASAVVRRLAAWGAGHGATQCYLQVDEANEAALALYHRLGFSYHHRYHYRAEPADGG